SSRRAAPGWTDAPPPSPRHRSAPTPSSRSSTSPTVSNSPPAPPTSSPAPWRRSRSTRPDANAWTPGPPRAGSPMCCCVAAWRLRRGAAAVIAVDIGHDQLVEHVRTDPRVTVRDGTSVRDLTPELLGTGVDLIVADLSFISLRTVIPALAGVVRCDGELLL